ncbi:MAG TPA: hypothetical protein V6D08_20345 [Candidatus Obscuribacterales bacterium]
MSGYDYSDFYGRQGGSTTTNAGKRKIDVAAESIRVFVKLRPSLWQARTALHLWSASCNSTLQGWGVNPPLPPARHCRQ